MHCSQSRKLNSTTGYIDGKFTPLLLAYLTCNTLCHMGNSTLSVMPGTRSRTRKYVNSVGSQISSCQHKTFEKQPCRNLPKCETKSYAGGYDPFFSQVDKTNKLTINKHLKSKRKIVSFEFVNVNM